MHDKLLCARFAAVLSNVSLFFFNSITVNGRVCKNELTVDYSSMFIWSQHQQISGDSFEWNLLKMFCVNGIPNRFALIMFWIRKFKENLSFHKFHMKNAIRWFNFRKHLPQNTEHRPKYEKTPATIVHTPYISSSSVKFQQYSSVSYRHNVYGRQQKCKISIFSLHWAIELKVSH